MITLYRAIVAINLCLYITWFYLPYFTVSHYSSELINITSWSGSFGVLQFTDNTIPNLIAIALTLLSIGLLIFQNWARYLFAALVIGMVLASPLFGVYVSYGIEYLLFQLLLLLQGSIIAFSFGSTMSQQFSQ